MSSEPRVESKAYEELNGVDLLVNKLKRAVAIDKIRILESGGWARYGCKHIFRHFGSGATRIVAQVAE